MNDVAGDSTITAYFSLNVYTITASRVGPGSISPSGSVSIIHGQDTTFVFTPDTGAHLDSVVVNGVNKGTPSSYTMNDVAGDSTIAAYFSLNQYTISASKSGPGSISPSGSVGITHGQDTTFSFTPDTGAHLDSVVVNGVNKATPSTYTMSNVEGDSTITAYFSMNVYTITASKSGPGTITPSGSVSIAHGQDTTFSFTPDKGAHLDSVVVNGVNKVRRA